MVCRIWLNNPASSCPVLVRATVLGSKIVANRSGTFGAPRPEGHWARASSANVPKTNPAIAHKYPGARLIGVAWRLGIIAWSLLFPLSSPSRLYGGCERGRCWSRGNPTQEPYFGSQVLASVGTYGLSVAAVETQTAPAGALPLRRVAGVVAFLVMWRDATGQDQVSSEIFILAFVFLAAFFGSIAVALGWLG